VAVSLASPVDDDFCYTWEPRHSHIQRSDSSIGNPELSVEHAHMRNSPMEFGYLSIVEEEALNFGARRKVIVHASQGVVVECEQTQVGHACVLAPRENGFRHLAEIVAAEPELP